MDRKAALRRIDQVRQVLLADWDPLRVGSNPMLSDEYDAHLGRILRTLDMGEAERVVDLLVELEEDLGVGPARREGLMPVARRLLASPMTHPLDRPVWSAFTGRQAHLALRDNGALRVHPDFGLFAATADDSPGSLKALGRLVRAHGGEVGLVERFDPPLVPGTTVVNRAPCWQMVAETLAAPRPVDFEIIPLTDADAPEMLALATLTAPGPFFSRTHELGEFVGVKVGGRLVAMAGERMRPEGFTEVSGVCAHPDHRGKGYAAALMLCVARKIVDRGETPFLHSYAHNAGAIALYEALGFRFRCEQVLTVLAAAA